MCIRDRGDHSPPHLSGEGVKSLELPSPRSEVAAAWIIENRMVERFRSRGPFPTIPRLLEGAKGAWMRPQDAAFCSDTPGVIEEGLFGRSGRPFLVPTLFPEAWGFVKRGAGSRWRQGTLPTLTWTRLDLGVGGDWGIEGKGKGHETLSTCLES